MWLGGGVNEGAPEKTNLYLVIEDNRKGKKERISGDYLILIPQLRRFFQQCLFLFHYSVLTLIHSMPVFFLLDRQ